MGLQIMKSRLKFHKAQKHNCREVYCSSPGFQIFQELISSSDNKLGFTVHSSSCSREANKLLSKMQEMEASKGSCLSCHLYTQLLGELQII